MKKLISLILAVIMIFSVTAVAVSAADETTKPVKITFVYDEDDGKGNGVPRTKEITVNYGDNFTSKAPKGSYTHAGWKYTICGWTTEGYGKPDYVYDKQLPTVSEGDGITELTFYAVYDAKEVTLEGVVGDTTEDIVNGLFGDSTMTFINYIIEQIKVWFGKLLLLLGTMM
jgi:hypothetical protein